MWVKTFRRIVDAKRYLGNVQPVVSRLGLIVKHKKDKQGKVISTKKRLILDAKASHANDLAAASQRIILPRPIEGVDDALKLMRHARARQKHGQEALRVEHLVADFSDAYWMVPLHPEERPFQVAMFRQLVIVTALWLQPWRG